MREEVAARRPGWQGLYGQWHWWWRHGEVEPKVKIWDQVTRAFNRGERVHLFDPARHLPPWDPRYVDPELGQEPPGHRHERGNPGPLPRSNPLRIPLPRILRPARTLVLPNPQRLLPCDNEYCACAGEGHVCAGCGAETAEDCSCGRCGACRRLVRGRKGGGAALYVTEDEDVVCGRCYRTRSNPDLDDQELLRAARAGDTDAAARWVRSQQRRGKEVYYEALLELGLAEGLEQLPYDKRGGHVIHTGHKTFDRLTTVVRPGQVQSETQSSRVIRAFNDVNMGYGEPPEPGRLQNWDFHAFGSLDPFVRAFVTNNTRTEPAVVYKFSVPGRDLGYVVTRYNSQLLGVFARGHLKAKAVIEAVTPIVSWRMRPDYVDLVPTGIRGESGSFFDGMNSLNYNPGWSR